MAETAPPTQPTPTPSADPGAPGPAAAPGAPPPGAGPRFGAGVHVGGADWPAQAADAVVRVVGQVRDRTVAPAYTIARGLVYGLLAAILATMALVLVLVALVRFIDVYLPGDVWSAYLLLGTILTIGGLVLWSQRRPTPTD
ncbi:MAG TPA: hypothetical protein VK866_16205 [Acidimicrobiales bacterium]|nr:hypothetical protein [Acidimicrobiales bacterium]